MERPTPRHPQLKTLMTDLDMDWKLVDRYFKIHRTVVEMLEARKYEISESEKLSTLGLHDFMKFLKDKKSQESNEMIQTVLVDLLDQKMLLDDKNEFQRFCERNIPELVQTMNIQDISNEIDTHFKKTSKLVRNLEDILEERIKQTDTTTKTIEFLNQIYQNGSGDKIFVYYYFNIDSDRKEGKKRINDVIKEIVQVQKKNKDVKDIVFIAENKLNTQMVDDLKRYTEKMRITIFLGDYLLFNITKHFLVPKHHLMSSFEIKEFIKDKEKGFVHKLPKIYETDPISRFYGAKAGQMFKIIRENLSDDSMIKFSEFYRYVVPEIKK